MEQDGIGMVDILEIYHARQLQQQILGQLKRLRNNDQHTPLCDLGRKREVVAYYEALLITVAEMLHQMGDRVPAID